MEKTKKSTVVGFHVTREPRSFAYPFVSSPYDRCSAETANFLFLLVLSCHSPIIIHALVELKPQARLKQERAAVGCYFFPEAENITTVPLTLVLTFSKCSESICVKPSSESFVFEKMPF